MQEWLRLSEEEYRLNFRTVAKWRFRMPDGQESSFDMIIGPAVAIILALTPDSKVILTKQFRPGPGKILEEMPGGLIDTKESPIEAAQRELLEETGYQGDIKHIGYTYQGSYSNVVLHAFVAKDCRKITDKLVLDKNEFIEPFLMDLTQFRQKVKTGQMTDTAIAYMGLDYLDLL